jgi:hypothetical protein
MDRFSTAISSPKLFEKAVDPLAIFLYALKAPETKRQYPRRFKVFLDFLKLEGTFEEQAKQFLVKARRNPQWVQDNFMQFIAFQIGRARRKEIAESIISNYYKVLQSEYQPEASIQTSKDQIPLSHFSAEKKIITENKIDVYTLTSSQVNESPQSFIQETSQSYIVLI